MGKKLKAQSRKLKGTLSAVEGELAWGKGHSAGGRKTAMLYYLKSLVMLT
jgi:hypothetical protein